MHVAAFAFVALASAQKPDDLSHDQSPVFAPRVNPASDEGRAAIARFEHPAGFQVELVAAEPAFANPVCFYPANDGSFYVGETFRHHQGVTDIRDHMDWLDDDLAARTVADRVAYFRKHLGVRFHEMETAFDRISLLRDTDGDGIVDKSTVFSERFTGAEAGILAGLLEYHGDVYCTCIPSLWRLRDTNGDDRADVQQELSTGYGVHVALLGHDMHGLRIGPDQRLYFSIGDRGFDVKTAGGELQHPQSGAVLRCELDGSGLEVFADGLRNPQELVFDAFGNLFTGDNNSDGGDRARLVQVVEGSDSGWRQSYQWITEPSLRGPWNDERLWEPHFAGQAAYILPPIANFADGPSGITIDPGTGFPEAYAGHLFLCDFRGDASTSGVHSIELEPKNAGFGLKSSKHMLWKVLATDCDFGPDGALYVTDWTQGWSQPGKGRLYRVFDPAARGSELARTTRTLLASGPKQKTDAELAALLAYADQRVRQEAQFELVARGERGAQVFERIATSSPSLQARVHSIWGLAIQARKGGPDRFSVLIGLLADRAGEVRAQAARVLGDLREKRAFAPLLARLQDDEPRVRMYAALALARIGNPSALEPLVELIGETKDTDPVLRHAAIFGLAGCTRPERLVRLADDPDLDVRLAAVVALRRHGSPLVARFLADRDALVRTEAARAIADVPMPSAFADLAACLGLDAPAGRDFARRAIQAAFREGKHPELLARFALRADHDEASRREALERLAQWNEPPSRDPVTSAWRPFTPEGLAARRAIDMKPVVASLFAGGIGSAPDRVLEGALKVAEAHAVASVAPAIEPLVVRGSGASGVTRSSSVRCAALNALATIVSPTLRETVQVALADPDGDLRARALEALTRIAPGDARLLAERVLADGELRERRAACRILGALADPNASAALAAALDQLAGGVFPVELQFDLVSAARARKDPVLDAKLLAITSARAHDAALLPYLDGLFGGDRESGKKVFREKSETACLRCHKTEWDEGGDVGPDLRGVGKRLSRVQILESIVAPNRHVAAGYRTTLFALKDDKIVEARVLLEDADKFRVIDADAKTFDIDKREVESKRDGLSSMPVGFEQFLTPLEMRDLIEYLGSI